MKRTRRYDLTGVDTADAGGGADVPEEVGEAAPGEVPG